MSDYIECKRCGKSFIDCDDGLFVTCRKCRIPDTGKHTGCSRFDEKKVPRGQSTPRPQDHRENTMETKYGIDR